MMGGLQYMYSTVPAIVGSVLRVFLVLVLESYIRHPFLVHANLSPITWASLIIELFPCAVVEQASADGHVPAAVVDGLGIPKS